MLCLKYHRLDNSLISQQLYRLGGSKLGNSSNENVLAVECSQQNCKVMQEFYTREYRQGLSQSGLSNRSTLKHLINSLKRDLIDTFMRGELTGPKAKTDRILIIWHAAKLKIHQLNKKAKPRKCFLLKMTRDEKLCMCLWKKNKNFKKDYARNQQDYLFKPMRKMYKGVRRGIYLLCF